LTRSVQCAQFDIQTRATERDEDNLSVFPDMSISGTLSNGKQFEILSEHKWDSQCDPAQLRRYVKIAQGKGAEVAFIGSTQRQKKEAAKCDPSMPDRCFLWEEVFQALGRVPQKSQILEEFMHFMKAQGLSPGEPLSVAKMKAFVQSTGFENSLERLANKLLNECEWLCVPSRYRSNPKVSTRWGRAGIEFATPDWKPTITAGFLFAVYNHKVSFVKPNEGIDLLLRVEASPKDQARVQPVLDVLRLKRPELKKLGATVLLKSERGNGNPHSLLIARCCLADVIAQSATEAEQVKRVHHKLESWIKVLFADGKLESAFKKAGLTSGMR
jgi:hypothetical protein